eukprot:3327982-Amphidinium_carterae.1
MLAELGNQCNECRNKVLRVGAPQSLASGSYLMIEGHPCKCVEMSTSKGGKHGHAKALFEGIDIFTGPHGTSTSNATLVTRLDF